MKHKSQIEYIKTEKLIPYARNSRKHSTAQVQQIAASIKEFGFLNPILIGDDETLIAGHGRLLAANTLGMAEVPCIKASHLTETQRRAYVLVDNRLAETSEWDKDMLKMELEELTLDLDFDLGPIGFSTDEIESLLKVENMPTIKPGKELEEDDFSEFDCKCPRCSFEFNK